MTFAPEDAGFDPEYRDFEDHGVREIQIPSRFATAEEFIASVGASSRTEFGSPIYFGKPDGSRVLVDLNKVNWEEVRHLRGESEPTGTVAALRKHVKRISGAFGL